MKIISILLFVFGLSSILNAQTTTTIVGNMDGVFNVSDLGGASYVIPVKVPPGIKGLEPSLSLVYNSQAGNGLMGTGWALSAGSAISRSGNNIYHDKKVNAVDCSINDKFTLDGSRLIVTSGAYGSASSQYRTEVESFRTIIANGTEGNGPMSFTVTDQNGLKYEYGATTNSRAYASGMATPYMWLLSKVTDLNGNYLSYEYYNTPGEEMLIKYINYVANTNILSPQCRIVFGYENKPDPNFIYMGGSKIASLRRLQSIRVQQFSNGTPYVNRAYNLEYATDLYTHLVRVIERGTEAGSTIEQLPPTDFTYGGSNVQNTVTQVVGAQAIDGEFIPGDYNGDGLQDYVKVVDDAIGNPSNNWELYLNNGNGTFSMTLSGSASFAGSSGGPGTTISIINPGDPIYQQSNQTTRFDYDGDGSDEFLMYKVAGTSTSSVLYLSIFKFKNNGTSYTCLQNNTPYSNQLPFVGDYDGDGRAEILLLNSSVNSSVPNNSMVGDRYGAPMALAQMTNFPTGFNGITQLNGLTFDAAYFPSAAKIHVLDYNGDGKSDILAMWGIYGDVYSFDASFDTNLNPIVNSNSAFKFVNRSTNYPTIQYRVFPGDFNGDGAADVLTWKQNDGWQIGYGKGDGSILGPQSFTGFAMNSDPFSTSIPAASHPGIFVSDYNGDGKSDVYYASNTAPGGLLSYSVGNNTFLVEGVNFSAASNPRWRRNYTPMDVNGDGAIDFLLHELSKPVETITFRPNEKRHLLTQITNGLGAVTKINYGSLVNNANLYGAGTAYTYPYVGKPLPLKVVSSINNDNGVNSTGNTISYGYYGLRYNLNGKGILGFDKILSIDQASVTRNEKTFALNTTYAFPYLQSAITRYGTGIFNFVTLSSLNNVYGIYDYGNKRILPYVTEATNTDAITGVVTKTTSSYTAPSSPFIIIGANYSITIGKPASITVDKGNGLEVNTQYFTYPNTSDRMGNNPVPAYIYSKPSVITTVNTRQGQPAYTRTQNFTYNAANGLIETAVSDLNTTNAVTQNFIYTNYGNVTGITTSAPGQASRTEITQYDPTYRFPILSYNAAYPDIKVSSYYNPATGNIESTTQPDGFKITNTYDGLNRLKSTSDNGGAQSTTIYGWSSSNTDAPANARYYIQTTSNTAAPTYKFYDRLGRLLRTAYKGFNGTMIYEDVTYNNLGQVVASTKPYFSNATPVTTSYTYDTRGRIVLDTRPEGNITYSYVKSGGKYVTTITNASGQSKKTYMDISGRVDKMEDNGGALEYIFHSSGKQKSIKLNGTTVSEMEYDELGRQKKLTDPNFGSYEYAYNAYDEMTYQKDPKGNTYSRTYNALGRIATKTGAEGTYTYTYNTSPGVNCGKMVQVAGPSNTVNYGYGLGDKINYEEGVTGSESFRTEYTYDGLGRVASQKYPNGKVLTFTYNGNDGALETIALPGSASTLHSIRSKNALGQITYSASGAFFYNGTMYNAKSLRVQNFNSLGLLIRKTATTFEYEETFGPAQQDFTYDFDPVNGNLRQRKDIKYSLQEDFTYDNLDRLTVAQGQRFGALPTMFASQQTTFSINGNIETKNDAGTFSYDQANRVSEINPYVNIPATMQNLTYTQFNKVGSIEEGQDKSTFDYWPDESRSKMELYQNSLLQKIKYYASGYEKELDVTTNTTRDLCYVYDSESRLIAILERNSGVDKIYYVLTDHLGSITQLLDENGNVVKERSYDAWGRMRDPQTWTALPPTGVSDGWDRGYTAHEHIPKFGIINMNGRLYDPLLGRMMEPDPHVQDLTYTQNFNRYSYVWNNPLKYTDPTGEYIGWDDLIAAIAGGAINLVSNWGSIGSVGQGVSYFLAGAGSGIATLYGGPMAGGAVAGLTNSAINQYYTTGNINVEALLQNTIQSAMLSQVGGQLSSGIAPYMSRALDGIKSPILSNVLQQVSVNSLTGFTLGAAASLNTGLSGSDILNNGLKGAVAGAGIGIISGTVRGLVVAKSMERDPWTGRPNAKIQPLEQITEPLPLPISTDKVESSTFKHNFKYAARVRMRAVEDPVSHNFPYSFDDEVLSTEPIPKNNGYKIFQQHGSMNERSGVFEIGLKPDGTIDHRFFRPYKTK